MRRFVKDDAGYIGWLAAHPGGFVEIGARVSDDVATWVAAIGQVRTVGRVNLAELRAVRDHLRAKGIADRSLIRILDALLWVSSPGSGLFSSLAGWERVFRPRTD